MHVGFDLEVLIKCAWCCIMYGVLETIFCPDSSSVIVISLPVSVSWEGILYKES